MPSQSAAQQRLMGMALAAKRGKGHFGSKIHEVAESMSEKQLRDFARTKHENLPEKKSEVIEALKFKLASLNSSLNTIGELALGQNYIPQPENGESVLDAMLARDHRLAIRNSQGEALANNPVVDMVGLKGHPALKALGYFDNGQIGEKLSPLLGGNTSRAVQNLHEGLNSPSVMQNFGRVGPGSTSEKNDAMEALVQKFHKSSPSESDGNAKTSSEKLVGGKGDNKPDARYIKKELARGIKHEQEHTNSKSIAKEIAKDHLEESARYYSRLAKAKIE